MVSGMSSGDPDRVVEQLFDWSQRLVGIDGAILFVVSGEGLVAGHTFETPAWLSRNLQLSMDGPGAIQQALRRGSTQVLYEPILIGVPGGTETLPWSTTVCVPLVIEEKRVGVYVAGWSAPYEIARETVLVLEGSAAMAASAINGAQLLHEVKREQQRLQSLIDRLPIPAIQFSEPGFVFTQLNSEARHLFPDMEGKTLLELMKDIDVETLDGSKLTLDGAIQNPAGTRLPQRFKVRTPEGTTKTIQPHVARFGAGGGVIILVDITRDANLETQRQRFVRMVSHHLRTPLTPLVAYAELIRESDDADPERSQVARDIGLAASEILDHVSRLEQIANLQPADPGSLSVATVEALVEKAWASASADPGDLMITGDRVALVLCVPDQIVTAMAEVVSNAYVHGKPPVEVDVSTVGDTTLIAYKDSGSGIARDWAAAVFAPYVDSNPGYSAPADGHLGLGLALARGLTEASHGELAYEDGRFLFRLTSASEL
jgi:signal transduction histidine kinase